MKYKLKGVIQDRSFVCVLFLSPQTSLKAEIFREASPYPN